MTTKCEWCGGVHTTKCPQIKAVEYHPDGTVKRYEFFGPKDYPVMIELNPPKTLFGGAA